MPIGNFFNAFTNAALGSAQLGLSIYDRFNQRRAEKRAQDFAKEMAEMQNNMEIERMGLQAKYNEEAANYSQKLAKDMYSYTFEMQNAYNNPEAEKQRLKEAGLNPALMYANGAGGNSTAASSNGGTMQPTQALQPMALQVALQAEAMKSSIELQKSQTTKNLAEAAKTVGMDTIEGIQSMNESKERILSSQAERAKTFKEIGEISEKIKKLAEETREKKLANDITEETYETQINTIEETYRNLTLQTGKLFAENQLFDKELKAFDRKLQILEDNANTNRMNAETAKEKLIQEWELMKVEILKIAADKELKNAQEIKMWIDAGKEVLEFIPFGKGVKLLKGLLK